MRGAFFLSFVGVGLIFSRASFAAELLGVYSNIVRSPTCAQSFSKAYGHLMFNSYMARLSDAAREKNWTIYVRAPNAAAMRFVGRPGYLSKPCLWSF